MIIERKSDDKRNYKDKNKRGAGGSSQIKDSYFHIFLTAIWQGIIKRRSRRTEKSNGKDVEFPFHMLNLKLCQLSSSYVL